MTAPPPAVPRPDGVPCRICGGECHERWRLTVARDRYTAQYVECVACRSLQVRDPYWLADVYGAEGLPPASNADSGRFRRNFSAYSYLAALAEAGLFSASARLLDFGGGYGLLTQMLLDGGHDAWTSDEYVTQPFFAPHRQLVFDEIPASSFDVVVALEVFEHLLDPMALGARLRSALRADGTLIISTGIYDPRVHDDRWPYLAREGGQHITFWTRAALQHFAGRFGFRSLGFFPGADGFLIVFSPREPGELEGVLSRALAVLDDGAHRARITRAWDFRETGVVADRVAVVPAEVGSRDLGLRASPHPASVGTVRRLMGAALARLRR